jgi:uncharacterized repeat protein (TIGR03803 family)
MRLRLAIFCVLAATACGRGSLTPSPGAATLSALDGARPATLHVVPLHSYTFAESFVGKSGGLAGLVGDPNTALFGIAPAGGDLKCRDGNKGCGFIYELTPQAGGNSYKETPIYTFHGATGQDGAEPSASLLIGERGTGVLYGTTVLGGAHSKGVVFRLTPTTKPFKYKERLLYSFGTSKTDGEYPYASLIEIHRVLYGTTSGGGTHGKGVAFSISVTGAGEKTLHDFGRPKDGATPYASLIAYNGTLYGTTSTGGSSQNCGTVFSLSMSGAESVLHSFQDSPHDGCNPLGSGVTELNGVLYGTTSAGGEHNYCHCGTIYSMSTSDTERVLHSFSGGGSPVASLTAYNGVLYGTTFYGGRLASGSKCSLDPKQGCGVAFSLNVTGTPAYQVQFAFAGTRDGGGAGPAAPLLASGGDFFGTTSRGSMHGHGEAFELTP